MSRGVANLEVERWMRAAGIPCPDCPLLERTPNNMNPDTGAIAKFETDDDAKAAGFTEKLTEKEVRLLSQMNRHERRAWLSRERKSRKASHG